jgi:uncharacterized protein YbjT (DUF2867 family)
MASVLILGATGYIGRHLVPVLLQRGHRIRCLVRHRQKIPARDWQTVDVVEGDILQPGALSAAFRDIDVVYYLVHSMGSGVKIFADLDRQAALNATEAAAAAGIKRVIYLGGLGKKDIAQSLHLRSRHEVGDILRSGSVPVTEFRAAVIIGAGSTSFEMIHHLTNRLPVMICPRWVYARTQPIGIDDVLRYLADSLDVAETAGKVLDIGGPDVITYRDMMLLVARILGLRRYLLQVPVLTPRLSSYWVNLVTPIRASVARALIDSLRHDTVCEHDLALRIFDFQPKAIEEATRRALGGIGTSPQPMRKGIPGDRPSQSSIDPSHFLIDRRVIDLSSAPEKVFGKISALGGATGWYYADWLWRVRGWIDELLGGTGMRRGRRHPHRLETGDVVDCWVVEDHLPGSRLLLRAEMRVWGWAWLEFSVAPGDTGGSRLTQTAYYYPRGLSGLAYWYSIYPVHAIVFRGMIRGIARAAEAGKGV